MSKWEVFKDFMFHTPFGAISLLGLGVGLALVIVYWGHA